MHAGSGGSGVDMVANASENHTISFTIHTINSQTVC